ncbi:MAG: hypothetical protein E7331_06530 [Clostridiales bacterium]|nr:hypothetical protein [Clostridiales bacterium]
MNRKKWFSLFTAIMTAMVLPFSGMASEGGYLQELQGYVTLMVDGGFIMNDVNLGQVLCNVDETTVMEGDAIEDGVQEGDYVLVTFDGRLTRSIPPQAHADRIVSYKLEGVVLESMTENMLAIEVPEQGEVWVYVENLSSNVLPGMNVTVYYDGIMALSYPARVSARELVLPEVNGTVGEMTENGFMLTLEDGAQLEIATSAQTRYSKLHQTEATEEVEAATEEEVLYAGVEAFGESAQEEPEQTPAAEEETAQEETAAEEPAENVAEEETQPAEETAETAGEEETATDAEESAPDADETDEQPAAEAEASTETIASSEETASTSVNAADFLGEGDRVTVYYGGSRGGEGPLHALKIIILN